ncbi:hypothetical protein GVX81_09135 [[Haemophilus] felis]|uniref:Uncharacterized protein n=1 Tax=[Haemophilus] felis TaxID=123822 RepID=A0A1T0AWF3_9PAST|nr:hypothetical protein [[Haemophilus] felis]NBI43706.1 hypothetical protein [[Haemophilus] felis]OOS02170.1 hypothetical protein B0188_08935 [[Haemophilus] felis]
MKKGKIFVFIVWGVICILWLYAILSGTLSTNLRYREENTQFANQIINSIKFLNADYQVINGRSGGTFSFKVTLNKVKEKSDIASILIKGSGFREVESKSRAQVFCEKERGVRITYLEERVIILEYERELTECADILKLSR